MCRPCEQQVSLWRVWSKVLASSYWPRLCGERGNESFNNNTNHLLDQKQRNASLLGTRHSICDEQHYIFKGKSLYKFCNWVKLVKSLGKVTAVLCCKLVSQPTLYFLYWEDGCLKCQQSWERDRRETPGSFQVTSMCQTVRHFTKTLSVLTGKVSISANTTCGLKPI